MRLAIGGIIHDREGIPRLLEPYLRHISNLQTDGLKVEYVWVVDSNSMLLMDTIQHTFPDAHLLRMGAVAGGRYVRGKYANHDSYGRLADLRNRLSAAVLELGMDALLTVDSDILVPADLIQILKVVDQPWVAALVRNHPEFLHFGLKSSTTIEDKWWNVFWFPWQAGLPVFAHFKPIGEGPDGSTWPRGAMFYDPQEPRRSRLGTGAVCWYSRSLLEQVRWATRVPSPGDPTGEQCKGEDVGFAIRAFEVGFSAAYVPVICDHIMDCAAMARHQEQCPSCASTT